MTETISSELEIEKRIQVYLLDLLMKAEDLEIDGHVKENFHFSDHEYIIDIKKVN